MSVLDKIFHYMTSVLRKIYYNVGIKINMFVMEKFYRCFSMGSSILISSLLKLEWKKIFHSVSSNIRPFSCALSRACICCYPCLFLFFISLLHIS